MAVEVDALQLNIGAESGGAAQEIDSLKKSLTGLLAEVRNASALGTLQKQLQETGKAASTARKKVAASASGSDWSSDRKYWTDAKTGQSYRRSEMQYYIDQKNVLQANHGKMLPDVYALTKRMEGAIAQDALRQEAAAAKEVASAKNEAAQAAKRMAKADNQAKTAAKEATKATKEHKTALQALRDAAHNASQHGIGKLVKQFARMLRMRAVRSAVRGLINSFKEGYHSLYGWSRYMGGDFASGIDSARNSLATMKNALATAIAPVIQAALPYVQQLIQWIRSASDAVSQFFAVLQGKSTWTRAKDITADQMEKINKNAKGAKQSVQEMLASFDELNVIQSENNGSGSGSTPNYAAYKDLYEEVSTFDSGVVEWAEKLREPLTFVKDHFTEILLAVGGIKAGLLLWKFASGFLGENGLGGALTKLTGIQSIVDALGAIGVIGITISIVRHIQDVISNETTDAMENKTEISEETKKRKKDTNILELFSGGVAGLAGKVPTLAAGAIANGAVSLATKVDPLDMFLQTSKYLITKDPSAGFRGGEDNLFARYVATSRGLDDTRKMLNGLGIETNNTRLTRWWQAVSGKDNLSQKDIDALDKAGEHYENFAKQWYKLEGVLDKSKKFLQDSGVEYSDILDNWKLIAPMIDAHGIEKSAGHILYLIEMYGDDWIGHINEISTDTKKAAESIPGSLAEGIDSDDSYRKALTGILADAKLSLGKTMEVVNNTKLTAPLVDRYGYEGSLELIRRIAQSSGNNTKTILENWDLLAPRVNESNMEQSMENVNKLIALYGEGWKNRLDVLDLMTEVEIKEENGWDSRLTSSVQTKLDLMNLTAQVDLETKPSAIDKVKEFIKSHLPSNMLGGGASSSSGSGGSASSPTSSWNPFGTTGAKNSVASGLLTFGGSTARSILDNLYLNAPAPLFDEAYRIKTNKGKEDSRLIETWNLTPDEVQWLLDSGFNIRKDWGRTKRGIRQIRQFADGGTVPAGQLFLAREKGAEFVGTLGGNSGAAVANNQQIVQGISQGVENANRTQNELLREQNSLLRALLRKDNGIKPSAALGRILAQSEAMYEGMVGV